MRQVLALVTLSHITIPSSLSVRASSYLVSLPHEHLNGSLDTSLVMSFGSPGNRKCSYRIAIWYYAVTIKAHWSVFKNRRRKTILDTLSFQTETLEASGMSIKTWANWAMSQHTKRNKTWENVKFLSFLTTGNCFTQLSQEIVAPGHAFLHGFNVRLYLTSAGCWMLWMDADQWEHYAHKHTYIHWGGGACKGLKTADLQWGTRLNQLSALTPQIHLAWFYMIQKNTVF